MGLAAIPRGTRVRFTRTSSGRCEGIVVLPSSGGASETPEGTTVRSSIYVVVRLGAFFTSSLSTGRTFLGTRVRGIIVCPVGKRHPVGRGERDPGCPPLRYRPARGRGGQRFFERGLELFETDGLRSSRRHLNAQRILPREIERDIFVLLEKAHLADAFGRDAASGEVSDGAGFEFDAGVRDIHFVGDHRDADGL